MYMVIPLILRTSRMSHPFTPTSHPYVPCTTTWSERKEGETEENDRNEGMEQYELRFEIKKELNI